MDWGINVQNIYIQISVSTTEDFSRILGHKISIYCHGYYRLRHHSHANTSKEYQQKVKKRIPRNIRTTEHGITGRLQSLHSLVLQV